MRTAFALARSPSNRGLCGHFLRNLTSLLVTNRSIGQSLASLQFDADRSPEVAKKVSALITTGQQGETDLRKPLREAGIVLPVPNDSGGASRLVTCLYQDLPAENSPPAQAVQTVVNLRLLAQHLELRSRVTAEEAKLLGAEPLRRVLLNWAHQWWTVAQA